MLGSLSLYDLPCCLWIRCLILVQKSPWGLFLGTCLISAWFSQLPWKGIKHCFDQYLFGNGLLLFPLLSSIPTYHMPSGISRWYGLLEISCQYPSIRPFCHSLYTWISHCGNWRHSAPRPLLFKGFTTRGCYFPLTIIEIVYVEMVFITWNISINEIAHFLVNNISLHNIKNKNK